MVRSAAFTEVVGPFLVVLRAQKSSIIGNIPQNLEDPEGLSSMVALLRVVAETLIDDLFKKPGEKIKKFI